MGWMGRGTKGSRVSPPTPRASEAMAWGACPTGAPLRRQEETGGQAASTLTRDSHSRLGSRLRHSRSLCSPTRSRWWACWLRGEDKALAGMLEAPHAQEWAGCRSPPPGRPSGSPGGGQGRVRGQAPLWQGSPCFRDLPICRESPQRTTPLPNGRKLCPFRHFSRSLGAELNPAAVPGTSLFSYLPGVH